VASVRSCASSRMTTLYLSKSGSLMASRSSMPSVMNLQDRARFATEVGYGGTLPTLPAPVVQQAFKSQSSCLLGQAVSLRYG